MKHFFLFASIASTLFISCSKQNAVQFDPNTRAELRVEFDNIAGGADLQLNTATYLNAAGESFKVTKLKYFVSNFAFTNVNGTVYTVPQDSSYFLIDESLSSSLSPSFKVPLGDYKMLTFTIGVDSLRNTMDLNKRMGVLDPTALAADMYWSWNSGYIFFKMDGTSPVISSMGGAFQYHVGGFGGYSAATTNNLKVITIDLSQRGLAQVRTGKSTNIHLMADILKALQGSTTMRFASTAMVHSAAAGKPVADNYINMIRHDHTEN